MPNDEHIAKLLEGVEAWNNYVSEARRSDPVFTPNFENANLTASFRASAGTFSFDRIDLAGIDFRGANLIRTGLKWMDLSNANFSTADLQQAKFTGSDLTNANLRFADIENADFRGATLLNTVITRAQPWKAKLYSDNNSPEPLLGDLSNVKRVADFTGEIRRISEHHKCRNDEVSLYFRGESQCGWDLRPSVVRSDEWRESEGEMLDKLISRRPEDFIGTESALEQWVLAQHHGLPTRFLDVTRNPLVAIFNACKDDLCMIGRLHIFAVPETLVRPFNSDVISIIANFAKLKHCEQKLLLGFREENLPYWQYQRARLRLYQGIKQEKSSFEELVRIRDLYRVFVVEPKQTSERIRAQSGAFLVSAYHETLDSEVVASLNSQYPPPVYAHYKLEIPVGYKEELNRELDLMNISPETLSPGLDASANAVKEIHRS